VVMLRKMGLLPPMHRLLSMNPLDQQLATVRRLQPQVPWWRPDRWPSSAPRARATIT
jgi:hypothetical protein